MNDPFPYLIPDNYQATLVILSFTNIFFNATGFFAEVCTLRISFLICHYIHILLWIKYCSLK